MASNIVGAAPWNEKIDCFSSPTAKKVRTRRTRALAGQEVGSNFAQDVPLRLRSILRLVDQNMVDAGIELVEHPGRVDVLQQRAGALDQIVEIEPAARVLELA